MKKSDTHFPLSVRMPPELMEKLRAEAARDNRPISQVVLLAVRTYLEAKNAKN